MWFVSRDDTQICAPLNKVHTNWSENHFSKVAWNWSIVLALPIALHWELFWIKLHTLSTRSTQGERTFRVQQVGSQSGPFAISFEIVSMHCETTDLCLCNKMIHDIQPMFSIPHYRIHRPNSEIAGLHLGLHKQFMN